MKALPLTQALAFHAATHTHALIFCNCTKVHFLHVSTNIYIIQTIQIYIHNIRTTA